MNELKALDVISQVNENIDRLDTLVDVLIDIVEDFEVKTVDEAVFFASRQKKMSNLLCIAVNEIFSIKSVLKEMYEAGD